ncbi:hypothetical protein [Pontiella agarivorans]|uniref:Uncharacterized protein n=1 Tax=Pontiella agarivorans TaxID=3038953 RepID=A0ABU5N288_9BACT|nr:hypothetical protein [Pontiella agarivorans]MDZ8120496.1 hypothetical protein [Pontiella agarivorans]
MTGFRTFGPCRGVTGRLLRYLTASLFFWLFIGGAPNAVAQVRITGFNGNGSLNWTNRLSNAVGTVQWSPSLTAGDWRSDWGTLRQIPITNETMSVPVPMFYRVLVSTNRHSGVNLAGWTTALGDGIYAPDGVSAVTTNDIETTHFAEYSELEANGSQRRIMAHHILLNRIYDDTAANFVHDCGYSFRLPYLPATTNPVLNAQTLEGGLFIWNGEEQLDYGGAFQWILNPWTDEFGDVQVWTGFGTNEWVTVGFLEPDTDWHDVRMQIDFQTQRASLSIDGNLFPFVFTATPKKGWDPESAARLQVEIVSTYPGASGFVHRAQVKDWFWNWNP